jgi:hypothetical protein
MSIPDRVIICYSDGTEAQVGDTVLVDEDWRGVVRDVVDTKDKLTSWNLDEYGLMVDQRFLPERFLHDYPVDLVSRPVA